MVDLGMPAPLPAPLAPRRHSRQIKLGSVLVGGGAPVSVQSMATTLTADVNATLQQIAELTASGCQIVRVAVPSQDDADALAAIAKKSQILFKADIGAIGAGALQIHGVWVAPEHRGQGIGSHGMASVVRLSKKFAPIASLYVNDFNHAARASYKKVGFIEVGMFTSIFL